jgi:hypothetical protein
MLNGMGVVQSIIPDFVKIEYVANAKGDYRNKKPDNDVPNVREHIDIAFQITKVTMVVFNSASVKNELRKRIWEKDQRDAKRN